MTKDPMTLDQAWEILTSYCIGDFKRHCSCDTIKALSLALNELGPPKFHCLDENFQAIHRRKCK